MPAKWRCLWGRVALSRRLNELCPHDALLYTWGIAAADSWGLMRRADAKALIFPKRSGERAVQSGIERLLEAGLLCAQRHNGDEYVHWCEWDFYQAETVRWRTRNKQQKPFEFVCPNKSEQTRTSPD